MLELKLLNYQEEGRTGFVTLSGHVNTRWIGELERLCGHLEDERPVDALVFRSSDGYFSRGIDLKEFDPKRALDIHGFHRWEKVVAWLEKIPVLTLAAVDGQAIGAGFHLLLACDLRVSSRSSTFGLDEVRLGFLPGMTTFRLAKFIGLGRARDLVLTGRVLTAPEALSWGLVDAVVAPELLLPTVRERIAQLTPINTVSVELARRLLNECYAAQYEDAIGNFLAAQHRTISTDAFKAQVAKALCQD